MAINLDTINRATSNVRKNLQVPKENYIIFHHVTDSDGLPMRLIIPVDPDSIQDNMSASFAQNFPLSRSAPIYSYQYSGPRTVQVGFTLHRDLCNQFNPNGVDAVDSLITNLQAMALPNYEATQKIVDPPVVSLRLRDEVYIKGVVIGGIGITYKLPLIKYGSETKYAVVDISFTVYETTPYSASILPKVGGNFRA